MAQQLALIDRDYLREHYLEVGFRDLLIEVLSLFGQQSGEYLGRIETALRQGDCAGVEEQAHALKGSAGSVGAARLCDLAKELESAAEHNDLTQSARLVAQLPTVTNETNQAITAELLFLSTKDDQDFF